MEATKLILAIIGLGAAGYWFANMWLWNYLRFHLWNKDRKETRKPYMEPVKPFQCAGCMGLWFGIIYFAAFTEVGLILIILFAFTSSLIGKLMERYT